LEAQVKTIKQLREAAELTQLELALKVGVTPSAVYGWESGRAEPKLRQLRALALVFGVSMDTIAINDADLQELKTAA
jgi:transcriptional regulator with XRE-family HTH domain